MIKKCIALTLTVLLAACVSGCGKKEAETPKTVEEMSTILDTDEMKLAYLGKNPEASALVFEITNKLNEDINVYFSDIAIDGRTEQPESGVDCEANAVETYFCDVSDKDKINRLTAIFCVDNAEGEQLAYHEITDFELPELTWSEGETVVYSDEDMEGVVVEDDEVSDDEASGDEDGEASDDEASDDEELAWTYEAVSEPVVVLDNDDLTITFVGYDEEEPGLVFDVYNKTKTFICGGFDWILVDGSQLETSYVVDVISKTTAAIVCDVPDPHSITSVTALFSTDDFEGNDMSDYEIKDVAIVK